MTKCIPILLLLVILGWQESCSQTVPPVRNDIVCRPHILKQCQSLNYNTTLPNLRGQNTSNVIEEEFLQFEILFRYNCSNALLVLLCSVYAPFCGATSVNGTPVVLKPCRHICEHVYDGCIGVFNEFQYQWPEILTCENFPVRGEVCFGPDDPASISYPNIVSPNSTIPLPTTAGITVDPPSLEEQPQIIINPPSSQIRAPVGSQLPLYCIAVKGYPIPVVQWHSKGIPVHPLSQPYQQIYLVPTDSPHTTTYTCVGTTFEHGSQEINVTVIVENLCQQLRAPRNGDVTMITTNAQQVAVFSCDRGYTMRGSHVLKCNNGEWNSPRPTCRSITNFCRQRCNF